MDIRTKKPTAQSVYIPEEATEEEFEQFEAPTLSAEQQAIMQLHKDLTASHGDAAPLLSQLEAWKKRWSNINVSKISVDKKEMYIWRTLKRYEYKAMMSGGLNEADQESLNEMLVEKCLLYPQYSFEFRNSTDAGVISTLGQQISYKSGFVTPQEALSLIYVT